MKLVIADDEVLVRKGISMSIPWEELGIDEVFEASDGKQAYEIIMQQPIDLLITDVRMPKMDGLELLDKVRKESPGTVNIVLSCVSDMECVREAMKFNKAIDYIPKLTMSTDELMSVIRRAISFVKENTKISQEENQRKLPVFFVAEDETRLRQVLEYGTEEELVKLLNEIYGKAVILKSLWRESGEWDEIISVFSSVGKKYGIHEKDFMQKKLQTALKTAENKNGLEKEISALAYWIKRKIEEEKRRSYDKAIEEAISYIKRNYGSNLKLKEVAEHAGMSESYFSRYFKKVMGEGYSEYLNKVRVEKAKELLAGRRITMQEVGEQVGYPNPAYFTQIFKNITGVSPKAYQKQKWEK